MHYMKNVRIFFCVCALETENSRSPKAQLKTHEKVKGVFFVLTNYCGK